MKPTPLRDLVLVEGRCGDCPAEWRHLAEHPDPPGKQPCPVCEGTNTTETEIPK